VADAFFGALDVAIEHRGVGVDAQGVGGAVDLEPLVGADLALEDLVVDAVVEDFGQQTELLRRLAGVSQEVAASEEEENTDET
jgi:hypothetical protein